MRGIALRLRHPLGDCRTVIIPHIPFTPHSVATLRVAAYRWQTEGLLGSADQWRYVDQEARNVLHRPVLAQLEQELLAARDRAPSEFSA